MAFLDKAGLQYLWTKLKDTFIVKGEEVLITEFPGGSTAVTLQAKTSAGTYQAVAMANNNGSLEVYKKLAFGSNYIGKNSKDGILVRNTNSYLEIVGLSANIYINGWDNDTGEGYHPSVYHWKHKSGNYYAHFHLKEITLHDTSGNTAKLDCATLTKLLALIS